jgi:aminotransferase in exopolysaccharide biosynthesis
MSDLAPKYLALLGEIRALYGTSGAIPLHEPRFFGNEKKYVADCIDSTFVSSVGEYVDRFEAMMCELTGARYAVATTNGTVALHTALILAGVADDDEVITQPMSFVATCNAIAYQRAHPVFVDVDRDTLSLSPTALRQFLEAHAGRREGGCYNRGSGRRISALLPMHSYGLPGRIEALADICDEWGLVLVEDAAEAIGARVGARHAGTFGRMGAFSFNGNKTITCGGGGCVVTDDEAIGRLGRHLTTTAKVPHPWEFFHDQIGYNYRLPNLNAALACAQLEQLPAMLANKRATALAYKEFCAEHDIFFIDELPGRTANFWLNAVITSSREEREAFLAESNAGGIMTRPVWTLMHRLPAFADAQCGPLDNAEWLEARVVCLPSSMRLT